MEERPWGKFEVLSDFQVECDKYARRPGKDIVIKKITVKPGERLSYQTHQKRKETWIFVQGSGLVIQNGLEKQVLRGDIIEIQPFDKHRVINNREDDIVFIEVSEGEFDEKDIERLDDKYNRHENNKKG